MDRAAITEQLAGIVAGDGDELTAMPPDGGAVFSCNGIVRDLPAADLAYGQVQLPAETASLVAFTVAESEEGVTSITQGWRLQDDAGNVYRVHFWRPLRGARGLRELICSE